MLMNVVGVGNLTFQKATQWLRTKLVKVDFDFVVKNRVRSTVGNPSRSPCQSLFKTWSPLLSPKHV